MTVIRDPYNTKGDISDSVYMLPLINVNSQSLYNDASIFSPKTSNEHDKLFIVRDYEIALVDTYERTNYQQVYTHLQAATRRTLHACFNDAADSAYLLGV